MSGFTEFCGDLFKKDKLDDSVLVEFLTALSPLDIAELAALANRSGYFGASASDVERFFQTLAEANISAVDFGAELVKSRMGISAVPKPSWRERLRRSWRSTVEVLAQMTVTFGIPGAILLMWGAVRTIRWEVLLQFAGVALGITVGADLLIWGFAALLTAGENKVDRTHEWRYVTNRGLPGGRARSATVKDLYEHSHGHGSWQRRNGRIQKTCGVLAVLVALACPVFEMPFLEEAGVHGIGPIAGYFLIYPLLPIALIFGAVFWLDRVTKRIPIPTR